MTVYVASDEITVNTTYARTQAHSDSTQLADGNTMVVWVDADFNTTADRYIRAQVYSPDGQALSPELTLLAGNAYIQPAVTGLADGTFVLTWKNFYGVQAQVFTANGTAVSPVMQVSPISAGAGSHDVVALTGGGFAISWQDERASGGDTSRLGIHVRTYDATGTAIGDTLVNVATSGNQQDPSIAALPSGGFVVTWSDHGTPGAWEPWQIKGRTFDAAGMPTSGEFLVGNPADGSSVGSSVTILANGNFAVAWSQGGMNHIQIFDPTGSAVSSQIVIEDGFAGTVVGPELIGLADGGFALAWQANTSGLSDGSGYGIYVQAFDADGQSTMDATLVNTQTNGDQFDVAISATSNGGFVVSWTDVNGAGADDDQVKARFFEPEPEGLVIDGTAGNDTLSGGNGNDLISGLAGNDTLHGLGGDDVINGDDGNDLINGGEGDDILDGGNGTDQLIGGAGSDHYFVSSAGDTIVENAGEGTDLVLSWVTHTLGEHLEELVLLGTNNSSGFGNAQANIIHGNSGYNRLYGLAGNDTLHGGDGGDTLDGGAGNDVMNGNSGDDSYYVDSTGDWVNEFANEGLDTVNSTISYTLRANFENLTLLGTGNIDGTGNDLANRLTGNAGINWLQGGGGGDWLVGGAGGDILDGGTGNDTMYGGVGSDLYIIDATGDQVIEYADGGWLDRVEAHVTTTIPMNVEILYLAGSADLIAFGNQYGNELQGNDGANGIYGRGGGDTLKGNAGNDLIMGEAGDDILWGGEGRDDLYGGTGADSFSFYAADFAGLTDSTCDRIYDFSQAESDTIWLNEIDANSMEFGDQAFNFIGDAAFSGAAGELRTYQDGGNTYVQGDVDGDGAADFLIRLDGLHSLTGNDFMF